MLKKILLYLFMFLILLAPVFTAVNADIYIGAIVAKTGPASFLGQPEAKTLTMLEEKINANGGVKFGDRIEKIKIIIKDSKGDPSAALDIAKQFIEKDKVIAIIGPSTSGESLKLKGFCDDNKTIMISLAAAEDIVNPIAPYIFKTPQKDSDAAKKIFEAMKKKGIKKIGILSSNTGFGSTGKAQLEKIAPEYNIEIEINEVYDKNSIDLTPVLKKLKNADIQAIINWSIEPVQGIIAKNMKALEFDIPLFQSHGFGNLKYVQVAGVKAAEGIIFPGGRLLVCDSLSDNHKEKSLLQEYKSIYEKRFKEGVCAFGGYAHDALMLLIKALEKKGFDDKDKIREGIETMRNFSGVTGIFNFSKSDHSGIDKKAFELLTVKNGAFEIYK